MIATDLGILLLVLADAVLARHKLVVVTREHREIFSLGRTNPVTLRLTSLSRRKLTVRVTDDYPDSMTADGLPTTVKLDPRGTEAITFRLTPWRRGAYTMSHHTVRYRSPLGFLIRQYTIEAESPIRVYPDVKAVAAFELLARQARGLSAMRAVRQRGGESEFESLREYQHDDPYRAIDWRATARRDKLIVRSYQLERGQNLMFALDSGRLMTAHSGGLSLFDHAVNASLMLAHVATRGGDNVGLMSFADNVERYVAPRGGRAAVNSLVRAVYDVHPRLVESDLDASLGQLARQLRKRSLVVVFTQLVDHVSAELLLKRMRSLQPRHLPLCIIFQNEAVNTLITPEARPSSLSLYTQAAAAELLSWRDEVLRHLSDAGALVIDVPTGQLTPALITQYLKLKARHLL